MAASYSKRYLLRPSASAAAHIRLSSPLTGFVGYDPLFGIPRKERASVVAAAKNAVSMTVPVREGDISWESAREMELPSSLGGRTRALLQKGQAFEVLGKEGMTQNGQAIKLRERAYRTVSGKMGNVATYAALPKNPDGSVAFFCPGRGGRTSPFTEAVVKFLNSRGTACVFLEYPQVYSDGKTTREDIHTVGNIANHFAGDVAGIIKSGKISAIGADGRAVEVKIDSGKTSFISHSAAFQIVNRALKALGKSGVVHNPNIIALNPLSYETQSRVDSAFSRKGYGLAREDFVPPKGANVTVISNLLDPMMVYNPFPEWIRTMPQARLIQIPGKNAPYRANWTHILVEMARYEIAEKLKRDPDYIVERRSWGPHLNELPDHAFDALVGIAQALQGAEKQPDAKGRLPKKIEEHLLANMQRVPRVEKNGSEIVIPYALLPDAAKWFVSLIKEQRARKMENIGFFAFTTALLPLGYVVQSPLGEPAPFPEAKLVENLARTLVLLPAAAGSVMALKSNLGEKNIETRRLMGEAAKGIAYRGLIAPEYVAISEKKVGGGLGKLGNDLAQNPGKFLESHPFMTVDLQGNLRLVTKERFERIAERQAKKPASLFLGTVVVPAYRKPETS